MPDTTYNGWRNYETWNVNLWLANEEPLYDDVRRIVEANTYDGVADKDAVAAAIESYVTEDESGMLGLPESGMAADLIGAAFSAVDWDAIAEAFCE